MGFVKTAQELKNYYALKDRLFPEAAMMGVMFSAESALTARMLPPPLEQADMPGGLIFIAKYGDTNLGPGYTEAALFVRCKYNGVAGSYCLAMPIDSEPNRLHNGRDIFGFPKKSAKIHFERDETSAIGWVERQGVRVVEIKVEITGELPELPPSGPTYLFKASPRIDLEPGFDGPVLLCSQQTEIEARKVDIGSAEIKFGRSEADPWYEFEGLDPIVAFVIDGSNRMLPGKVLAEVDGDTFLPHYFKMTDFFAGEGVSDG